MALAARRGAPSTSTSTTRARAPSRVASAPSRVARRRATPATATAPATADDADEETQDATAKRMAIEFAVIADDTRAVEVQVLHVAKRVYYARYVVLATAFNRPQMHACCAKMRETANETYGLTVPKSAARDGDWACLDCADVVVHVFSPQARARYDLDGLYGDAAPVALPFETETRDGGAADAFASFDDDDDADDDDEDEFEVFE